jgi:hypothetical protein
VTNWWVHSCPSPIAVVRLFGSDRRVSGLVTDCVDPAFLTQLRHFESMCSAEPVARTVFGSLGLPVLLAWARFLPRHKHEVRPLCAGRPVSPPIVAASLAISIPPPPAAAPAPMAPAAAPAPMTPTAAPAPMTPPDLRDGIGRICEVADNRAVDRQRRSA